MQEDVLNTDVSKGLSGVGVDGMSLFAALVYNIGRSTKTTAKLEALVDYFFGC